MSELPPCPFCKGKLLAGNPDDGEYRHPDNLCYLSGEWIPSHKVERWNRRAPAPATSDAEDAARSVWIVLDEDGLPDFCATYPEACHEHINQALMDGVDVAAKWVVREATYIDAARGAK